MKRLITHGLRNGGALPQHNAAGLAQLANLPKFEGVTKVIVGTGIRFLEIYWTLVANGQLDAAVPVKYSPFCGTADGYDAPDIIPLADGTICKEPEYIGISQTAAFDAWKFISEQPDGTLFLAGGELIIALGYPQGSTPKGALFTLDSDAKTYDLVAQG